MRDSSHSDLIEGSSEEGSESGSESDLSSSADSSGNGNQVLLSNETFNEFIWVSIFIGQGKSGVLGISVQSDDSVISIGSSQSLKGFSVSLSG